ncbi:FAD-dependent thymidylate synthase [Candidatus Woesearchaeota archaeon]|nr:FAD-dependent thymidylate synthase [Candidatus Woesearchaeota archaeon]
MGDNSLSNVASALPRVIDRNGKTYSKLECKALERFVTSATDRIYACRADLPPEVFGAFGSFFSRNPKDLRNHILDAIRGRIPGHEGDVALGEKNVTKLASGEFTSPAEALKSGVSKAQAFFREWYGKYSHKSIANVVWIPFVGTNVSQLFARQLAYDQLAFFIEQSTRFVKFDVDNLYLDQRVMDSQHRDLFVGTLRRAAEVYEQFTERAADHYGRQLPFDAWLQQQNDTIKAVQEKPQRTKYRRELKAKAFDVARLLLPQAVRTNIAWILDARSTEFDIAAWKGHPLAEIKESALLIEKAGGEIAPSLLKYTEKNSYYEDQYGGLGSGLGSALQVELPSAPMMKGVDVISYDANAFQKVVAMLLMRSNRSADFNRFLEYARSMTFDEKIGVLRRVTEKRGPFDEWVDIEEAFDCVKITAQIRTDIGAVRDLRRHQKWDRNEGRYTLDNGFYLPEIVHEIGTEAATLYTEVMGRAYDTERTLRKEFSQEAQYVVPMAAFHPIIMSGGLDQLQYLVATRTVPQGHFSYREDAYNLAEAVCRVHPWLLGLQEYPQGKSVEEVVRDAPLKSVLRPYIGDTGWHA